MELSRNQLKYIAAITMILDHIGAFLLPATHPVCFLFRTVGRLTMPIMCYFLAEGFQRTSSRKKYLLRLLLCAFISQPAYACVHHQEHLLTKLNVIFTLLLSFLVLNAYCKISNSAVKWCAILMLILVSSWGDWGIIAPVWVLLFYSQDGDTHKKIMSYCVISAVQVIMGIQSCLSDQLPWYTQLWQLGLYLFPPMLRLYHRKNNQIHPFHKWFFYVLYPLHLFILALFIAQS